MRGGAILLLRSWFARKNRNCFGLISFRRPARVLRGVSFSHPVKWFRESRAIVFENARIVDPVSGETCGSLRIAAGRIDGLNLAPHRGDAHFDLDGALILPAWINAHDHLELNNFPRWKDRESYANAREWALESNARLDTNPAIAEARKVPLADRLLIGGLKNLLSGAVTVAHHNPFHAALGQRFPVRVIRRYGWSHSLYLSPEMTKSYRRTPRGTPWMIHLAEGHDAGAQSELTQLDDAGALRDNTVLIHGVGLTPAQRERAIEQGAALVWCPSSNFFLLNETASVRAFAEAHLLALGSDSRLTGERDLLNEMRVARETNQISQDALLRAVTCDSGQILRVKDAGRIERGMRADLVILPSNLASAADAIGHVRRGELRAVLVEGQVCVGDIDFEPLMSHAARASLDGRAKLLSRDLAERITRCSIAEPGLTLA